MIGQALIQKKKQVCFSPRQIRIPLTIKKFLVHFFLFKGELMIQNLAFLQDNASIRKSMSTSDCLSANKIKALDIPSKSST